jgi:hypothetical protein
MNTWIFPTSLFCVALLCVPACTSIDLSGTRPEIAQPLKQAETFWRRGQQAAAMESLKAAEAVPNQTADEKGTVARVRTTVLSVPHNAPMIATEQTYAPSVPASAWLPPGDVGPNMPNR